MGNVAADAESGVRWRPLDWHVVARRLPLAAIVGSSLFTIVWVLF